LRDAAEPDAGYDRDNVIHETWLGLALLEQRKIEGACKAAENAIGLIERVSSPRALDHLRVLCDQMRAHLEHPEIRDTLENAAPAISHQRRLIP
jgi:hypothetical protein